MRIQSLSFEQFRSYPKLSLEMSQGDIHVLLGPNGAGKTNVLEAIGILSEGSSLLGREEEDLVEWGQEFYRVRADVMSDRGDRATLEVVSEIAPRRRRAFLVNDVRMPAQEFVALLPTVVFLPEDLSLFSGPPALRRSLLDRTLSQVSPLYRSALSTYQKALKQRNALLKHIVLKTGRREDMATWDAVIAREGALLTMRRLELLEVFQCTLREEMARLGEPWKDAVLSYVRTGEGRTASEIEAELRLELTRVLERDLQLQATTVGPHRDDWTILAGERAIHAFASRGQQRTAVLALLFLQGSYLELQRSEKPVILLDDVFSELDPDHQSALLSSFEGHQVFITTTHVPEMLGKAQLWDVSHGHVERQIALNAVSRSR